MGTPHPPSALRELRQHLTAPFVLAVQAGVALVLGLSGPFGTFESLGLGLRLPYWAGVVFGTYALGATITALLIDRLDRDRAHVVLRVLRGGALIGMAAGIFLALWNLPFFGWQGFRAQVAGSSLVGAFVVSWVVLGLRAMLFGPSGPLGPSPQNPAAPAILQRLPLEKRGELVALSATDHYVEVVTDRGGELVLMRLADAITETAPARGLQVHRSHWVALDKVRGARRRGDGALLDMGAGLEIPVSRRHIGAIRAAGLLPRANDRSQGQSQEQS